PSFVLSFLPSPLVSTLFPYTTLFRSRDLVDDLRFRFRRSSVLESSWTLDLLVQRRRRLPIGHLVLHRDLLYQAQAEPRVHRNSRARFPVDSICSDTRTAAHRPAHALRPFGARPANRRCRHCRRTDDCVTVNAQFSHKSIGLPILSKVSIPDSSKA